VIRHWLPTGAAKSSTGGDGPERRWEEVG
jgi:hypothetical protein